MAAAGLQSLHQQGKLVKQHWPPLVPIHAAGWYKAPIKAPCVTIHHGTKQTTSADITKRDAIFQRTLAPSGASSDMMQSVTLPSLAVWHPLKSLGTGKMCSSMSVMPKAWARLVAQAQQSLFYVASAGLLQPASSNQPRTGATEGQLTGQVLLHRSQRFRSRMSAAMDQVNDNT